MPKKNYQGYLLAANPNNPRDELSKSVILLLDHDGDRAVGLQINNPLEDLSIQSVAQNLGIWYDGYDPVWFGGSAAQHKIHVIHSLDWEGMSTVRLNDDIAVTNDISIIAALSRGEGPAYYRACSGFWLWEDGILDKQLDPKKKDTTYKWETSPATLNSVFKSEGPDQWRTVLEESARFQVASWF